MSFVHKIPPMVSALAFGYGVGMAAPDAAITPVRAAVTAYEHQGGAVGSGAGRTAATVRRASGGPESREVAFQVRGKTNDASSPSALPKRESRELERLRDVDPRGRDEAAACSLERPTHSQPPRYASASDAFVDDVEDLDTASSEALSRLQLPDISLTMTRRTIKYVRFFTRSERGRGMFETWLKRSGRYQDMVQQTLREWRLPEDLIWLAMIESGFDARARSPAGAVGLWQFMPATGAVYGLHQDRFMDLRKNPRLATQAAAHHLRDLHQRFGDWNLALAAYNMGYEQLLSKIDRYNTADFNELARQGALPQETAAYVPKIAAAALVANNLERFGFDGVKLARPIDAAEMAVPAGTPLRTLAKAAGASTATLRTLNPDLLQDRVPPGRSDYLIMIPAESLARAQASLPALLDTEPLATNDVTVLDPVDLLGGREFTRQPRGEESLLSLLPKPKRRSLRDPVEALVQDIQGGSDDAEDPSPRRRSRDRRSLLMYKVGPGDTLLGVARQFAVDVEDLARDNGMDPDGRLREGGLLKLRVRQELVDKMGSAPAPEGDGAATAKETTASKSERSARGTVPVRADEPTPSSTERRVVPAASSKAREEAGRKDAKERSRKSKS
ncbi:lytic transglycosylase domain-containing protein [Chondromyces crocatus]|uniref:Slt family transglycosylase n=1 Tax=Chondromyces crocatus TaxID=52 RepID=A0A0K1EDX4_CHOCO|nr:lytic transglycosylase domain-containing protein [Chondromyces crocatus]AKT38897.1 Slt family transglycosylase [Chondromyces crocatus]